MLRRTFTIALVALVVCPLAAQAQPTNTPQLYLTIFRNPSTGLELRFGRIGVHAGFYPTILKADGESEGKNTNFLRFGASFYTTPNGTGLYVSPSMLVPTLPITPANTERTVVVVTKTTYIT